jgi:hypothetical protein
MGKKGTERRNYSKEFKAEAAALAEKREKSPSGKPVITSLWFGFDPGWQNPTHTAD